MADSGVKAEEYRSLDLGEDRAEDVTTIVAGVVKDDSNAESEKRENPVG